MGYLFFDIETYVDPKEKTSGLNPYKESSKILAVAYNYYNAFILVEKNIMPPTILKEWEIGEKELLSTFYNSWADILERDKHLKIVGFNQIKFDIPYLFARMQINSIKSVEELFDILYRRPHYIDLGQVSMVVSGRMAEKKEFYNVNQEEANKFFDIPFKKSKGTIVSECYLAKDYDGIIDYIKEEFTFEKLYINLRRHIHKKGTHIKEIEK